MPRLVIKNVRIVLPGKVFSTGTVCVENGSITHVGSLKEEPPTEDFSRIDGKGQLLTPGLIDLHTHGIGQWMYELSPEELLQGTKELGRFGTTTILPTAYTNLSRGSLPALEGVARSLPDVKGIFLPGFHLEGPFLALPGAGAATLSGDLGLLNDILTACDGRITAMSVSPDTPNILPVIERLREAHITVFITHTQASAEQTLAAIDAGASHATHFYDVFPMPPETDPGVRPVGAVEVILADPRCTVDFIGDGVHVHPMAIRAALAAKGAGKVALITDSNVGAGLPAGIYPTPLGYPVKVDPNDAARIHDENHPSHGGLAGSALTMDRGMKNLHRWLDLPEHEIWAMATSTPAKIAGLKGKGKIEVGADADLVLWDDNLKPIKTWVAGNCTYDANNN